IGLPSAMNTAIVPATDRFEANAIFAGACGSEDFYAAIKEISELRIYPNPVHELLHVTGTPINTPYQIIDTQGRVRQEGTVENGTISMTTLPAGFYFLNIGGRNYQWVKE
ncbi:MAG: T9SS type A sorting domain-containing protein, partial [Flavobacteriales bacterium]